MKIQVLNHGYIELLNYMNDDLSVVNAARISYGSESQQFTERDETLLRYLMRHQHWTPFEMVQFQFRILIPMDAWRQMVRHRTASINEYSTRYKEAIDIREDTHPNQWRTQSTNNKQGSGDYLPPEKGSDLTELESRLHNQAQRLYQHCLNAGVAKEQARKNLPLCTYTEAIWSCDLRNILNFLKLRMDPHAQYEIREYANAMAQIVSKIVPATYEAFCDYNLYAETFSRMEMSFIESLINYTEKDTLQRLLDNLATKLTPREFKEFKEKIEC